jgi:hypothetical protein
MRGADRYSESLCSTVRLEDAVPATHPLRSIRTWVNDTLGEMDEKFSAMYEADIRGGRPSIAPEKLMRAHAAAGAVQHSQRAPVGRADQLQLAVPLVRRPVD